MSSGKYWQPITAHTIGFACLMHGKQPSCASSLEYNWFFVLTVGVAGAMLSGLFFVSFAHRYRIVTTSVKRLLSSYTGITFALIMVVRQATIQIGSTANSGESFQLSALAVGGVLLVTGYFLFFRKSKKGRK